MNTTAAAANAAEAIIKRMITVLFEVLLSGIFAGTRELHIRPDWLLCYRKNNGILTLTLVGTGTHSDLFGK